MENQSLNNLKIRIINKAKPYLLPLFKNSIKSTNDKNLLIEINLVMDKIIKDYTLGEMKTANLKGVRAYKIKQKSIDYRLLYYVVQKEKDSYIITFVKFGKRENIYKELNVYFKGKKMQLNEIKKFGI